MNEEVNKIKQQFMAMLHQNVLCVLFAQVRTKYSKPVSFNLTVSSRSTFSSHFFAVLPAASSQNIIKYFGEEKFIKVSTIH